MGCGYAHCPDRHRADADREGQRGQPDDLERRLDRRRLDGADRRGAERQWDDCHVRRCDGLRHGRQLHDRQPHRLLRGAERDGLGSCFLDARAHERHLLLPERLRLLRVAGDPRRHARPKRALDGLLQVHPDRYRQRRQHGLDLHHRQGRHERSDCAEPLVQQRRGRRVLPRQRHALLLQARRGDRDTRHRRRLERRRHGDRVLRFRRRVGTRHELDGLRIGQLADVQLYGDGHRQRLPVRHRDEQCRAHFQLDLRPDARLDRSCRRRPDRQRHRRDGRRQRELRQRRQFHDRDTDRLRGDSERDCFRPRFLYVDSRERELHVA